MRILLLLLASLVLADQSIRSLCERAGASSATCRMVYGVSCSPSRGALSVNVEPKVKALWRQSIAQVQEQIEYARGLTKGDGVSANDIECFIRDKERDINRWSADLAKFEREFPQVAQRYDKLLFDFYPYLAPPPLPEVPLIVEGGNHTVAKGREGWQPIMVVESL